MNRLRSHLESDKRNRANQHPYSDYEYQKQLEAKMLESFKSNVVKRAAVNGYAPTPADAYKDIQAGIELNKRETSFFKDVLLKRLQARADKNMDDMDSSDIVILQELVDQRSRGLF